LGILTPDAIARFRQNKGNLTQTARELEVSRDRLREYLTKAGEIDPQARRKIPAQDIYVSPPSLPQTTLRDLLLLKPHTLLELCEELNESPILIRQSLVATEGVRSEEGRFWIEKPPQPEPVLAEIQADRAALKAKEETASLKSRYETLLKEYEQKEASLNAALGIADNVRPAVIEKKLLTGLKGQATAISVISDWHAGAIVKPNTVNFTNEFNPAIFEERAHNYFRNLLTLINKERAAVEISQLVLAIIGDLIENSLHAELIEEQTLSPIEQMILAQNTIAGGIDYLLQESDLEHITIPTCPGNHGRTTDKMRAATNYKNSYEQLLYWNLARHYRTESRVSFHVSDSYVNYTRVYDKSIGWHHGDGTKFQGGVGGLIIPLRKFAYRVNQQRKIDVLVNGHWHTQFVDNDIWSNGSLVGATAYGMRLGFAPERPQQIFRLLDAEEGFTAYFPVLVERKAAA